MPETLVGIVTAWFALVVGILGISVALLLFVVKERFRGGTIGRGFGMWLLAVILWAGSILQKGIMELAFETSFTGLIHQILMAAALVMALAGTYVFYAIPQK